MDAKERKAHPIFSGLLKYFPKAMFEVAKVSEVGNRQHNPDKPLFWDRTKSQDELDALTRHLVNRAEGEIFDTDNLRHSSKIAWRALANLEKELEGKWIYLSGKISATTPEAQKANLDLMNVRAKELRAQGLQVFNPAELEEEGQDSWFYYLARDLHWIANNDCELYVMKDWEGSRGVALEIEFAKVCGKKITYE